MKLLARNFISSFPITNNLTFNEILKIEQIVRIRNEGAWICGKSELQRLQWNLFEGNETVNY